MHNRRRVNRPLRHLTVAILVVAAGCGNQNEGVGAPPSPGHAPTTSQDTATTAAAGPTTTPAIFPTTLPSTTSASQPSAPTTSPPTTVPGLPNATAGDRFGVALGVTFDPQVGSALRTGRQLGADWVRLGCGWARVEPSPGRFDWSKCDAVLNEVLAMGWRPLVMLGVATSWNTTAPPGLADPNDAEKYPPRDLDAFERYVRAMVAHYPAVTHWELWNEPDLYGYWKGSPHDYAVLLARAHRAVHATDPTDQLLLGGLSLGGTPGRLDEDFLEEILNDPEVPGRASIDVANFHHYGTASELARRAAYVRDAFAAAGRPNIPVWVTEIGYPANPDYQKAPGYQAGPASQAAWLTDMMTRPLALGVDKVFWFQLFDPANGRASSAKHYGLLDTAGRRRPAFEAYRRVIAAS